MKAKENYSGFKGFFKFALNVITWTALIILILLALFLAYYTINNKLYERKGEKFEPFVSLYTIVSGSMEPNINIYDVVISKRVKSPKEIKVGDVITFVSTSSLSKGLTVTHRVIEVVKTDLGVAYRTQGDNNLSPDTAPAEFDNVIGKVILRIPKLGKVQEFLSKKGGWLIAIIIPALFIIVSDILKIFKLVGVKNKINEMNESNERIKKDKEKSELIRKERLKKKLNLNSHEAFIEPIITKKKTRIVEAMDSDDMLSKNFYKNTKAEFRRNRRR